MVYNESKGGWLVTLAQYVAWLVTALGTIIDLLAIREAILAILAVFSVLSAEAYHARGGVGEDFITTFGLSAFDNFMLLIMGLGAIVATISIEYYFRKGRPQGLLFKRIGKVLLIEVAIVIVAVIIRIIMGFILQGTPGG